MYTSSLFLIDLTPPLNLVWAMLYLFLIFCVFMMVRSMLQGTAGTPLERMLCTLREWRRRWFWFYTTVAGLTLYPFQQYVLIRWQASQTPGADQAQAAAIAAAKVVDVLQVYSKFSVAIGAFCLINMLAWAAVNMVMPVLADWAKGNYSTADKAAAVGLKFPVVGMKRTFLRQKGVWRLAFFFVGMALELWVANVSVEAAFRIQ